MHGHFLKTNTFSFVRLTSTSRNFSWYSPSSSYCSKSSYSTSFFLFKTFLFYFLIFLLFLIGIIDCFDFSIYSSGSYISWMVFNDMSLLFSVIWKLMSSSSTLDSELSQLLLELLSIFSCLSNANFLSVFVLFFFYSLSFHLSSSAFFLSK